MSVALVDIQPSCYKKRVVGDQWTQQKSETISQVFNIQRALLNANEHDTISNLQRQDA